MTGSGHRSCYDQSGQPVTSHRSLTGPVTGHVMTDPVTGYRSVPQTVPVIVDVDTTCLYSTKVDAAAFLL
ncbi:hypothetical protein DPMN_010898 [Dreissena polymorpha]|uniref:Uncharacterized protein n=1 Tax=Dreissena polymorpha TaxID=45954 RepID=A0A9D4N314_DREPO|nr:hypothetical protein DPMN_010898 [Dreissena polymorpha]